MFGEWAVLLCVCVICLRLPLRVRLVRAVDARPALLAQQASLDKIAEERHRAAREMGIAEGFFNPHRSPLGLGNYDVVVLESAVQAQGYQWQVAARMRTCARVRISNPPSSIARATTRRRLRVLGDRE